MIAENALDKTLTIDPVFNGPPDSGNGGYVGGKLAEAFGGDAAVEITFRAPIPMARPLAMRRDGGTLRLMDGETLICEARDGSVDHLLPPPPPRDWREVLTCNVEGGSKAGESQFDTCLVCGCSREVGVGLRVFGKAYPSDGHSLSCYLPHANHADASGRIRPEFVWGTLDCPGAWAAQDADDPRAVLTGRMTAKVIEPPRVGERCAVVGWRLGVEGRKLYSGTALYTENGRLCALGHCTWIVLKD